MWNKTKTAKTETGNFGLQDDAALYRLVRLMTGMEVDNLYFFEAHALLEGGNVRVIRGGSSEGLAANPQEIVGKSTAVTVPEDDSTQRVLAVLAKEEFKELFEMSCPYEIQSASKAA